MGVLVSKLAERVDEQFRIQGQAMQVSADFFQSDSGDELDSGEIFESGSSEESSDVSDLDGAEVAPPLHSQAMELSASDEEDEPATFEELRGLRAFMAVAEMELAAAGATCRGPSTTFTVSSDALVPVGP